MFDGTLTAGAIGGEPYSEFSNPVASALKPFFKSPLILRFSDLIQYPLGDRICPTRRRSQYFVFYWKLVLFGQNNAQYDILGIHNYP